MTRMRARRRRTRDRDAFDTGAKYRPNPRASRGMPSTPARRAKVAALRAALPPPCFPTVGKSARDLVHDLLAATGVRPRDLSVMHVRDENIIRAARAYSALYARQVVGDVRAALEVPFMRTVMQRPGCAKESYPREASNRSMTPVVEVSDSISVVEWPPPPMLTSAALSGFVYKPVSSAFNDLSCDDGVASTQNISAKTASVDISAANGAVEQKAEVNVKDKHDDKTMRELETDEADKRDVEVECATEDANKVACAEGDDSDDTEMPASTDVIFVAPCTVEEAHEEDALKYSIVLATTGTQDALVRFAADIGEWLNERNKADEPEETHFGLYRLKDSSWVHEEDRRARKVESVFLPEAQRDDLVCDARRFFSKETRAWYADHGVPYRRAYLFHGPPGTGKTSMIKALSSELHLNSCFLSMMHALAPQDVADAIADLPPRPLIVIEDVDALFSANSPSKMTFSALLNILDGMMSAEGVLTIMTTNHVTRIDPIAIRAGRVDRLFFFGPAGDDVLRQCFRYFYNTATDELVERFVAVLQKERDVKARSIATLQEHFIEMREKSAEECVEKLPAFVKSYVNRATLLKELEDKFKADTGTDGTPFMLDGEKVNKYAETEDKASRPHMFT